MKTKKGSRLIEATYYNRNPKEDYAICVFERGDNGKLYDRVITVGSKEYCDDWVENYCRQYSWNRGMHKIKPVTEVNSIEFKRDYFGNNDYEDDFADLEDTLDNVGVSVNRRDVFGENKNKNKKNTIRLTESELKRVITESVKNVLKEYDDNYVDADISNDYNGGYDNNKGYVSESFETVLESLTDLVSQSDIPYDKWSHRQPTNKYQEINDWANNVLKQGNQLFKRYFG